MSSMVCPQSRNPTRIQNSAACIRARKMGSNKLCRRHGWSYRSIERSWVVSQHQARVTPTHRHHSHRHDSAMAPAQSTTASQTLYTATRCSNPVDHPHWASRVNQAHELLERAKNPKIVGVVGLRSVAWSSPTTPSHGDVSVVPQHHAPQHRRAWKLRDVHRGLRAGVWWGKGRGLKA